MNRLTHSFAGFRRSMQMSSTQVFVFVEGKTDQYFYGEICSSVSSQSRFTYTICKAEEIPGDTGGKAALLSFFDYLRRKKSLIENFQGKTTASLFFLDKDVDDFLRKMRVSEHIAYTRFYTLENHIYVEGNLSRGAAIASSLEMRFVESNMGNESEWRRNATENWKEWMKLCLFASKRNLRCEYTFSAPSSINNPLHAPVNSAEFARCLTNLENYSGLSNQQFQRAYRRISKEVDNLYNSGNQDLIFKGKWYTVLFSEKIREIAGTNPYDSKGIDQRLKSSIVSTLDFNLPWADHFKNPLKNIVAKL